MQKGGTGGIGEPVSDGLALFLHFGGDPAFGEVEEIADRLAQFFDQEMRVVLMLDVFELQGYVVPVVGRVEEGDEIIEVEVVDNHIVDTFGLDARMGSGEFDFADFFEYVEVFFVEHVFVEEESDVAVAELVPE